MSITVMDKYQTWLRCATADPALTAELREMAGDEARINDAFYRSLTFGTGGLRGVIGAGSNRMNVYTVAQATRGLGAYIINTFPSGERKVALSRDSRINSELFTRVTAATLASMGIQVHVYPELMPTPCLSYAVRALNCCAGVMVTASHNPSQYNGYKVYGPDGCQITSHAAEAILTEIGHVGEFDFPLADYDAQVAAGRIHIISEDVYTDFIAAVKAQSVLFGDDVNRNVRIVYSPLNGAGLKPVTRALAESGFTNVSLVEAQAQPDGHFPTCPYPNPEIMQAMALGVQTCEAQNADLLLATDPDCDRCGIAVRGLDGAFTLLTGNETGLLMLDFICRQRMEHRRMPVNPVCVKTIVTTDLAEKICVHYGVKCVNVLTGFKYIGEVIGQLEAQGHAESYICGFEESYGYLTGAHVRDKDAVNASLMIAEMFAWYKTRGISLIQRLNELYAQFGYCLNTLKSYQFEGESGMETMAAIMLKLRAGVTSLGGLNVESVTDYLPGVDGLPPADVLKFRLSGGSTVVVRPSGTEPKLKAYLSVTATSRSEASALEQVLADDMSGIITGQNKN